MRTRIPGQQILDGSVDTVDIADSAVTDAKLSTTGVGQGTYHAITVNTKGRVTAGSNPTTLAGYGILDAQPLDSTLTSLAAYNTNGIVVQTSADTFVGRSLTAPAAGLTITNPAGTAGNPTFALANDLSALEALAATGFAVRSAADTWVQRSVAGTAGRIGVTNGDGVAGDPTLDLVTVGTAGTYKSVTTDAYGRVTAGTNPTTLAGYGITDAQPLNTNLTALSSYNQNGFIVQTGANTFAGRLLVAPAAGMTITNAAGAAGNPTFALANDLAALEGLSANGIAVRTATDTWTVRQVTNVAGQTSVTNGDGISGNPTIGLASDLTLPGTGGVLIPAGTTAQRPVSPADGTIRYNTTQGLLEKYSDGVWSPSFINGTRGYGSLYSDFMGTFLAGASASILLGDWTLSTNGGSSGISNVGNGVSATDRAIGVVQLTTGTTTTGRACMGADPSSIVLGYGYHYMEARIMIPTLGATGQQYQIRIGFGDSQNANGAGTDGAYLLYDPATTTAWRVSTLAGGTATTTTTSTTPAANTWYKVAVEDTGTATNFYVDDVLIGTSSTNRPTGAAQQCGLMAKIDKTTGSTARLFYLDYIQYYFTLSTPR